MPAAPEVRGKEPRPWHRHLQLRGRMLGPRSLRSVPCPQPLWAPFPPLSRTLASSLPGPVEERGGGGTHVSPKPAPFVPTALCACPGHRHLRRGRRVEPGSPRPSGVTRGVAPLLPVPCLMLCSPFSLSFSPAACGAAWAGKAGWWCYPWFWDSQSKMTLPISPTCNPLGRSRTSRTLRGTRGMSEDEGSPAGGGDEGFTQGGGGGGG